MLLVALFAAALVRFESATPVRSGCDASDTILGEAEAGASAHIRMSMATAEGRCFKVTTLAATGWVPARALAGTEAFDAGVRAAPVVVERTPPPTAVAGQPNAASQPATLAAAARLLTEQHPKAALGMIEKTGARDFDSLVLAGMAARATDDPSAAQNYLEKALSIRQDVAVERVLETVRRELTADRSHQKLLGGRFLLRYEEGTLQPETARHAVGLLEMEYSRIAAELGCPAGERIVTIVQSPKAYRASTDAAEWSAGYFDGSRIRIPLSGGPLTEDTRESFAHEIVHACLAAMGDYPSWLHEGLAQKLSGNRSTQAQRQKVASLLRQGRLPRLANVTQSYSRMSAEHVSNAYTYALIAAETLAAMYPTTGIGPLLRNPGLLPRATAEIDRALSQ